MLTSHGDLAIAEIAFFSPAFLIAIAICIKQGFSKSAGWLYLVLLSILRLIGASCTVYLEFNAYSSGVAETAAITSSIGTAPLLLVLLGFLERIHAAMSQRAFSNTVFRPIHLLGLVALVLAIVGGSEASNRDSKNYDTGLALRQAGSVLFLVIYLALAGLTVLTAFRKTYMATTDSKLIIAGCAALPFLLIRIIYTVAVSFAHAGSDFYYLSPSVWVTAFMMFLMEAICIVLYSWAGLLTPKAAESASRNSGKDLENNGMNPADRPMHMAEQGGVRFEGRNGPARQQKSLGDYRPSRMIRNALRR